MVMIGVATRCGSQNTMHILILIEMFERHFLIWLGDFNFQMYAEYGLLHFQSTHGSNALSG